MRLCLWCEELKGKGMSCGPHSQALGIHGVPVPPSHMPLRRLLQMSASAVGARPVDFLSCFICP